MKVKKHLQTRVLVVDEEKSITDVLELILRDDGHEVFSANNLAQAINTFNNWTFDLVIVDLCLPEGNGVDLLISMKRDAPQTEVIVTTAFGSLDLAIEAIKQGAYYYLEKPYVPDQLVALTQRAIQFSMTRQKLTVKESLAQDNGTFGMVGHNPSLAATDGSGNSAADLCVAQARA
jgi:DNA-binding NtrC family response regulator